MLRDQHQKNVHLATSHLRSGFGVWVGKGRHTWGLHKRPVFLDWFANAIMWTKPVDLSTSWRLTTAHSCHVWHLALGFTSCRSHLPVNFLTFGISQKNTWGEGERETKVELFLFSTSIFLLFTFLFYLPFHIWKKDANGWARGLDS